MSDSIWLVLQFLVPFLFLFGFVVFGMLPLVIHMERKVSALIQGRIGPNRASILGFRLFGAVHGIADLIKLAAKSETEPNSSEPFFFRLAPFVFMSLSLMTMAVLPFAPPLKLNAGTLPMQIAPLNAGILYVLAVASLGIYGIILAGWSSGNRFAFLASFRACAQMLSTKLGLGLAIVGILVAYGTTDLALIVERQGSSPFGWGIWLSPLGFLIFFTCLLADMHRSPFDAAEGSPELISGFHIEYSGLRLALFYIGQYINMILGAAVVATLFFGGWQVPFLPTAALQENTQDILILAAIFGGLLSLACFVSLRKGMTKRRWRWGDMRDNEATFWSVFTGLAGVGSLVLAFFVLPSASLPSWVPVATQLVLQISAFLLKTLFFSFVFIWVRWSLPRFRYDQVMRMGWQYFLPLGVANIFITTFWARLWL